jgi:hypothetical protein
MSNLLRCGLIAAGIVAAFVGGYFLRNAPGRSSDSAAIANEAARPNPKTAHSRAIPAPSSGDPLILPPINPPSDPRSDTIDSSGPDFQMIKRGLNIQTTVLDKSLPVPSVLAELPKVDVPPITPIAPDVNPPIPPIAVGPGPTPPSDRPPPVAVPSSKIGDPFSPPGISLPDPSPPKPPLADKPFPRKLLVNTRQIDLEFAVTKTGLSKIKAVELWTTRDGGATWKQTDRMDGCASPFRTRLGSEGEYGFKMVFESESGQRTADPKTGQSAELTLELDTTSPSVSILPFRSGPNPAGTVEICWNASDRNLGGHEVRLEYSIDGRDWQLIDARQHMGAKSNFTWKYPPAIPARIFLRVSVRDLAGNVGIASTVDKVSIDLIAPEGKITGVRAMGSEPEKGPMPRAVAEYQAPSFGTAFLIW